jgi:hypothetical protein
MCHFRDGHIEIIRPFRAVRERFTHPLRIATQIARFLGSRRLSTVISAVSPFF